MTAPRIRDRLQGRQQAARRVEAAADLEYTFMQQIRTQSETVLVGLQLESIKLACSRQTASNDECSCSMLSRGRYDLKRSIMVIPLDTLLRRPALPAARILDIPDQLLGHPLPAK